MMLHICRHYIVHVDDIKTLLVSEISSTHIFGETIKVIDKILSFNPYIITSKELSKITIKHHKV